MILIVWLVKVMFVDGGQSATGNPTMSFYNVQHIVGTIDSLSSSLNFMYVEV